MGDIIDTTDNYIYLILMITLLVLIIKTDTNVFLLYSKAREDSAGLSQYFRDIVNNYWPTLIGILIIVLFILFNKGEQGSGYITLFILIFSAVFLTSYTIFQWETGGERRGQTVNRDLRAASCSETPESRRLDTTCNAAATERSDCNVEGGCRFEAEVKAIVFKPTPSDCSSILPKSNQFQTKEYQLFRFIYYFTLIIIATCLANNMNEIGSFSNIVIILPFLIPLFMELISEMVDFIKDANIDAKLSPELFLINFIRGGHTGGDAAEDGGYALFNDINWLEDKGSGTFFNAHFMVSIIFYMILILLMVYYSQGLGDNPISNTPLYWGLTIMIGFPFFMRYIFIQEESINEKKDMLPDGIKNINRSAEDETSDEMRGYRSSGAMLLGEAAVPCPDTDETPACSSPEQPGDERIEKKGDLTCRIEKYGGIQMMFCASFIIMILTKTNQKRDKLGAFCIMILLTYGLSQTFIYTDVYDQK